MIDHRRFTHVVRSQSQCRATFFLVPAAVGMVLGIAAVTCESLAVMSSEDGIVLSVICYQWMDCLSTYGLTKRGMLLQIDVRCHA